MAQTPGSPLVGRDEEIATLLAAAEEARAGQLRCVVVTGEAGIGKSRLVDEALACLDGALVLTGHGAELATGEIPFGVLADTLRDLQHQRGGSALTPAERAALSPALAGEAVGDRAELPRLLAGALDVLARLSGEQLVVWRVEDLHTADAASRDLLNVTVRSIHGSLLVVTTLRTGDPTRSAARGFAPTEELASLSRSPAARRIDLRRLTDDEVHTLLRGRAEDLSPATERTITRLSDGVPFVVEELAAAGGRPEQTTAAAVLAGRLARLGRHARSLVQAAAIGDHRHLGLLEQVVEAGPSDFDAALADATEAAVLVSDTGRDEVRFRHALVREAAIAETGPGASRRWHRRWAETLERNPGSLSADAASLAVAEHWDLAAETGPALQAAYAAIPAARRSHDEVRKLRLWQRILRGWEHRDPGTDIGQLALRQVVGEALRPHAWTVSTAVAEDFVAAARIHPLPRPVEVLLATFEHEMTHLAGRGGHRDEELATWADQSVDWLAEPPDLLTRAALGYVGYCLPTSMDHRAERLLRRAEAIDQAAGRPVDGILLNRGRAFRLSVTNHVAAAIQVLEDSLARLPADAVTDRMEFTGDLCWNYVMAGRHADADHLGTRQLESVSHPEVIPYHWEHVLENTLYGWRCTGEWARAQAAMAATSRWRPETANMSSGWLARVDLLQRGRTDERPWRRLVEGPPLEGPDAPDKPLDAGDARFLLALSYAAREELSEMRRLSVPLLDHGPPDTDQAWLFVTDLSRAEGDAAVLDPRRPDRAEAEKHLALMGRAQSAVEVPLPHDHAATAEFTAQLDRFHGRDARPALEAALQAWTELDHAPDIAVTHLSLAEAHAEAGDRDTAREHLVEGRRMAAELDARPWLDRATAIAHRYGFTTRDRRPEDVLTGREAEVLALLAEGATNHEIADTLVISPKTASVHVSRIIAKTGAGNRTEAVAIARRHGLVDVEGH